MKRNDEKEGEKQEAVFKRSDAKEDQKEKDTIDNSDEKGGQKEGDVLERSVDQEHDFDSMKGNVIEIPNPKDVRLSKRRKRRPDRLLYVPPHARGVAYIHQRQQ
ncbi:PREDICTED: uncharacterized protein LOC107356322 [Acropora digitifera]|uniref:uncharacterized protein LOC107356322 n=1 Tax=Acropora digitifera TaxID=70779 RepID=UPI00077B0BDC|nr:PREDICTED: uncharacterized protein LOC107356322 [Acropora digitifera]